MTCIVGIVDDHGTVYMGGDSVAIAGYDVTIRRTPKIFKKGNMLIGVAGYWRLAQVLQYLIELPEHPEHISDEEYIVAYFVELLREALKVTGYARKDMEQEHHDSSVLIGYRGQLYEVEGNYQVMDAVKNYYAIGSGAPYALGSLYTSEGREPLERVKAALEAAEYFSGSVRSPFTYATLEAQAQPSV